MKDATDPTLPAAISPASELAEAAISQAARPNYYPRRCAGSRLTGPESDATELRAVEVAMKYLMVRGWESVEDVRARESFDIHCKTGNLQFFVEVNGTQSLGDSAV